MKMKKSKINPIIKMLLLTWTSAQIRMTKDRRRALKLIKKTHKMLMIDLKVITWIMDHLQVIKFKIELLQWTKETIQIQICTSLRQLAHYINKGIRTRSSLKNFYAFFSFVTHIERKRHTEALEDPNWDISYTRWTIPV